MKKSQQIVLTAVFLSAIASCARKDSNDWTTGADGNGRTRDTAVYRNGAYHHYRYYGGGWYTLGRNNMINVGSYAAASSAEIMSPHFSPRAGGIRTGGFGSSAHASAGG
jgi:hypothetical protein